MAENQSQSTMDAAKDAARQALIPSIVGGTGEIAPTAGAAQVQAMVQARFVMALKSPRNMDQVRQDLLKECVRPSFALEEEGKEGEGNSALYRRPVGGGKVAEGLGIRFAEVAERCMGNLMAGALTISEDEKKKTKYCFVLDLQTNNSWEDTIDISKTVERRQPKQGDEVLSQRVNSQGQTTFTIAASEDALATKEGALISKKLRTLILRLIPGDLQDECVKIIKEARAKRITEDPDAAKKRIIDGMALQNITVTMLEDYLGHPVAQCTPVEILNLQGLYGSLRDGITTWKDIMENVEASRQVRPAATPPPPAETPTTGMAGAKAEAAAQQPATQPATTQPVTQPVVTAPPPQTPPLQPASVETVAEKPAETQQQPQAPTEQPAVQPSPQTATQPTAPTDGPPSWATQEPAAQPAAAQPAEAVAPLTQPTQTTVHLKGGPGKIVKDVQFPAILTRDNETEAWTPEQLARAETGMAKVNAALGKSFKLDSTIKTWFGCDLNTLTSQAMESIIAVLNNWK